MTEYERLSLALLASLVKGVAVLASQARVAGSPTLGQLYQDALVGWHGDVERLLNEVKKATSQGGTGG